MTGCGIEEADTPPPLPPGHPNMVPSLKTTDEDLVTTSLNYRIPRMIRRGSEKSLLSCSMSMGPPPTPSGGHGKGSKKSKTLEKQQKNKKKPKKSDTFSGRSTPSLLSSPAKSATMYFNGSPSHTAGGNLSLTSSFSSADLKTPKKSRWLNLRSKVGKKLSRSPSHTSEYEVVKTTAKAQRSQSIPSIKKSSIYSGRNSSLSGEDMGVTDGGPMGIVSPRLRKRSTSGNNNVNLVSKIFSVLSFWVEEFFEVSFGNYKDTYNSLYGQRVCLYGYKQFPKFSINGTLKFEWKGNSLLQLLIWAESSEFYF